MAASGKLLNIDTSPTKDVVVRGITRDASVEACILDLIDNSIDAAREDVARTKADNYDDYEIVLSLSGAELKIKDNCGGIPAKQFQTEVMRFGKRSEHEHGIGAFGVGLNRAIFKLGHVAQIVTDTGKERSELILKTEDYLNDLDEWNITGRQFPSSGKAGTTIEINRGEVPVFVEVGEAGIAVDECYAALASCSTRCVTYLD